MVVSNGRNFTDRNGEISIPIRCNIFGGPMEALKSCVLIEPNTCHVCKKHGVKTNEIEEHCIVSNNGCSSLRGLEWDEMYMEYIIVVSPIVMGKIQINVCEKCEHKINIVMKTSDYLGYGENWQIIVESINRLIDDRKWLNMNDNISTRNTKERMKIIKECAFDKHNRFYDIPCELFDIIEKFVLETEKEKAAIKIQSIWRGFIERKWSKLNKWNGIDLEQITEKSWRFCDDCRKICYINDMIYDVACANDCCIKYVCKGGCNYLCYKCEKSIHVPIDMKYNDGRITTVNCKSCKNEQFIFEKWYGVTLEDYEEEHGAFDSDYDSV